MIDISASAGLLGKGGRPMKFTPERIQQIRNLVERGKSREEIAEMLDVTVGSLQVTCSKLGVSLRRPRLQNGVKSPSSQPAPAASTPPATNGVEPTNGNGVVSTKKTKPADGEPRFALIMQYNGREQCTELPIRLFCHIALEAEIRGTSIAAVMVELIENVGRQR
jgi:hypothetical protein